MMVQSEKFFLIVFCINLHVSGSILAVASSKTMILFSLMRALARQTNCFCPELKFDPFSDIYVSKLGNDSFKFTFFIAVQIASSEYRSVGSMFDLIVPTNKSCFKQRFELKVYGFHYLLSTIHKNIYRGCKK